MFYKGGKNVMKLTGKTLECVTNDIRAFCPVPESDAKDDNAINRKVLRPLINDFLRKMAKFRYQ